MGSLPKIGRLRGIKTTFILVILAVILVVFAAVTTVLVSRETTTLRTNLVNESKAFAALATKPIGDTFVIYKDSGRFLILQQIEKFTGLNTNIANVAVVDTSGKVLFSEQSSYGNASVPAQTAGSFDPTYIYDGQHRLTQVIYPYLEDSGLRRFSVVYWVSNASIDASIHQVVVSLIVLAIAGMLLAALLIYLVVNHFLLNPLKGVSQDALAISHGAIDQQIKVKRKDEIADLADSINAMANALKADIQKLKEVDQLKSEFMVIASHNLRTPLTIMDGSLEFLRDRKPDQDITKFVNSLTVGVKRLEDFTEDMTTIARIEAGKYDGTMQAASLSPLIAAIATDFKPLADQKSISFSSSISAPEIPVKYNASYLRAAIWNILDNALKFTPENGTITLTLSEANSALRLEIKDSGTGIDPQELPRLFTKFHRGTDVMKYDYEGTGLGLYLTKLVIDMHKGTINVESQPGMGTDVTIQLPIDRLAPPPTETQT